MSVECILCPHMATSQFHMPEALRAELTSRLENPRMATQVLTSSSEIEMWGDGKQTRSFTFIDDCVEGILRVTKSDVKEVGGPAHMLLAHHSPCLLRVFTYTQTIATHAK